MIADPLQLSDPVVSFNDEAYEFVLLHIFYLRAFHLPGICLLIYQITSVYHVLCNSVLQMRQGSNHPFCCTASTTGKAWYQSLLNCLWTNCLLRTRCQELKWLEDVAWRLPTRRCGHQVWKFSRQPAIVQPFWDRRHQRVDPVELHLQYWWIVTSFPTWVRSSRSATTPNLFLWSSTPIRGSPIEFSPCWTTTRGSGWSIKPTFLDSDQDHSNKNWLCTNLFPMSDFENVTLIIASLISFRNPWLTQPWQTS